jgi:hypothetical protein
MTPETRQRVRVACRTNHTPATAAAAFAAPAATDPRNWDGDSVDPSRRMIPTQATVAAITTHSPRCGNTIAPTRAISRTVGIRDYSFEAQAYAWSSQAWRTPLRQRALMTPEPGEDAQSPWRHSAAVGSLRSTAGEVMLMEYRSEGLSGAAEVLLRPEGRRLGAGMLCAGVVVRRAASTTTEYRSGLVTRP